MFGPLCRPVHSMPLLTFAHWPVAEPLGEHPPPSSRPESSGRFQVRQAAPFGRQANMLFKASLNRSPACPTRRHVSGFRSCVPCSLCLVLQNKHLASRIRLNQAKSNKTSTALYCVATLFADQIRLQVQVWRASDVDPSSEFRWKQSKNK